MLPRDQGGGALQNLSLLLTFSAGILAFLSPCVLPLVPVYIGDLSASLEPADNAARLRAQTLVKTLAFIAGFSSIMVALGAAAGAVGSLLVQYQWLWNKIAGAVLVAFGLHLLGVLRWAPFLNYEKRLLQPRATVSGPVRSFLMGAAFSSGWTPCVGPVLSGVLALAIDSRTAAAGAILMAVFSLGLALPFVAIGLGLGKVIGLVRRMGGFLRAVNLITGVLVIAIGLVIFFNLSFMINGVLLQYFPHLQFP